MDDMIGPFYSAFSSINPEIDIGQVEGAFVMGLGYFLTERVVFDTDTGVLLTHNTWVCRVIIRIKWISSLLFQEYKPPTTKDIPIDFRIELLKDAPNPLGILGSKGNAVLNPVNKHYFIIKLQLLVSRHCV